jgi:hypothetical protein
MPIDDLNFVLVETERGVIPQHKGNFEIVNGQLLKLQVISTKIKDGAVEGHSIDLQQRKC